MEQVKVAILGALVGSVFCGGILLGSRIFPTTQGLQDFVNFLVTVGWSASVALLVAGLVGLFLFKNTEV